VKKHVNRTIDRTVTITSSLHGMVAAKTQRGTNLWQSQQIMNKGQHVRRLRELDCQKGLSYWSRQVESATLRIDGSPETLHSMYRLEWRNEL
jgi:hypothetical protein